MLFMATHSTNATQGIEPCKIPTIVARCLMSNVLSAYWNGNSFSIPSGIPINPSLEGRCTDVFC